MSIDQAKSLLDQIKSKVQVGDTVGGNESLAEMKVRVSVSYYCKKITNILNIVSCYVFRLQ